jgi:hypothetical protein
LVGVLLSLLFGSDFGGYLEFVSEIFCFVIFDFSFVLADVFLDADFFLSLSVLGALKLGAFF